MKFLKEEVRKLVVKKKKKSKLSYPFPKGTHDGR